LLDRIGLADRVGGGAEYCLDDAKRPGKHPQREGDEIAHRVLA
jgi:hypothetical protein